MWHWPTLCDQPSVLEPTAPLAQEYSSSAPACVSQQAAGPSGMSPLRSRWAPGWGWAWRRGRSSCKHWRAVLRRLVKVPETEPWTRVPRPTGGLTVGGQRVLGSRGGMCACPFPGLYFLWGDPTWWWQEILCGSCSVRLRHGVWAPGEPRGWWILWSQSLGSWSCGGLCGLSVGLHAAVTCWAYLTCQMVCRE